MSSSMVASAVDYLRDLFGYGEDLAGEDPGGYGDDLDMRGPYEDTDPEGLYVLRGERADFTGMAIIRARPETIDEAPQVAEQIKGQLPVIVNLEDVPDSEARRIVDFLGGVVYGLNGSMKKVARSVFICSPFDIPVEPLSISAGRGSPIPHEDDESADLRSRAL